MCIKYPLSNKDEVPEIYSVDNFDLLLTMTFYMYYDLALVQIWTFYTYKQDCPNWNCSYKTKFKMFHIFFYLAKLTIMQISIYMY